MRPTHPTPAREAVATADAAGYIVRPQVDDEGAARFTVEVRGRKVSAHNTLTEAQAAAVTAHQRDEDTPVADELAAAEAATEDRDRDAANMRAAQAASALYPEADPITYEAGRFYVTGRPFYSLSAAQAEVRIRADEARRQRDFQHALTEAMDAAGVTVELHEGDQVDQRANRRAPWLEQVVDVYRPATAGNLPRNGTVEIIDGRVITDTVTRWDLADQLGVPLPETADARERRRQALEEVRQLTAKRADAAATNAERAALAMHRATA